MIPEPGHPASAIAGIVRLIIASLSCLTCAGPALGADESLSLSTGLDYSTGTYGTPDSSEVWFLPLTIKYQRANLGFKLNMSYLVARGPQNVTPEGEPLPGDETIQTAQGIGDVTAALSATVLDAGRSAIGLDLTGKVKFATADPEKALGTGENDYTLQASLYQALGAWVPYLEISYRWKGDPPGIDYANVWYATAGTIYRFNKNWSAGADYAWRERLTPAGAGISEAMVYLNHKIGDRRKLNVYGVTGFSSASPDWETGLMLTQSF